MRSDVPYICPNGRTGCPGNRVASMTLCTGCLTIREREVLEAIAGGARSLSEVAAALDPPISWRTAEAHVTSINAKMAAAFEPKLTPALRVLVWVLLEGSTERSE